MVASLLGRAALFEERPQDGERAVRVPGGEMPIGLELVRLLAVQRGVEADDLGIPSGQISQLFPDFSRMDTGAIKTEGTGLGLALTRRIVEAQGGSVGVRSEVGHGSIFHARLPR